MSRLVLLQRPPGCSCRWLQVLQVLQVVCDGLGWVFGIQSENTLTPSSLHEPTCGLSRPLFGPFLAQGS